MLRKISIALLVVVLSLSLITDGYSNGRGRKVVVKRSTPNKVVNVVKVKNSPSRIVVKFRPPAPRKEIIPVKPVPYAVWISGYWTWDYILNEWVWIPGYWNLHPVSSVWVSGYWTEQNGVWIWIDGHWRL